jgi:hypothetical protein
VLLGGAVLALAFIALMETRLASRGFRPTAVDSEELWLRQRARAANLGHRALILIGESRMQLDVDLKRLHARTGLDVVQLAIDGSSFVPVLAGIAHDPEVNGTVVVSFMPHVVADWNRADAAAQYEADYERRSHLSRINARTSEAFLSNWVGEHMRSYADGATPLSSLLLRILPSRATPQYLVTLPDRSRLADYRLAPMPDLYYARVAREMGADLSLAAGETYDQVEHQLAGEIAELQPKDPSAFNQNLPKLEALIEAIQSRGGRVYFFVFPTGGMVREIVDRTYPRASFWDTFARRTSARAVHFEDVPSLQHFSLPDGSHLDYRDRDALTDGLIDALGIGSAPLAESR